MKTTSNLVPATSAPALAPAPPAPVRAYRMRGVFAPSATTLRLTDAEAAQLGAGSTGSFVLFGATFALESGV